jgi:hypothetical protein
MYQKLLALIVFIAVALAFTPSQAQAGPLRRLAYRATHPFAPIGSYQGPKWGDGTWKRRAGNFRPFGGVFRGDGGGCANGSCGGY